MHIPILKRLLISRFSGRRDSPSSAGGGNNKLIYDKVAATRWVGGAGNSIWERYYGSTATASGDLAALEAGGGNIRRAGGSNFGSGFTLDQMASNLLRIVGILFIYYICRRDKIFVLYKKIYLIKKSLENRWDRSELTVITDVLTNKLHPRRYFVCAYE